MWNWQVIVVTGDQLNLLPAWNRIWIGKTKQTNSQPCAIHSVAIRGSSPSKLSPVPGAACQMFLLLIGWLSTNPRPPIGREMLGRGRRGWAAFRAVWPPSPEWLRLGISLVSALLIGAEVSRDSSSSVISVISSGKPDNASAWHRFWDLGVWLQQSAGYWLPWFISQSLLFLSSTREKRYGIF